MLVLLKAHIGGYTRKDGTVVQAHDRIERHEVKDVADHIAGRFKEHGFDAKVQHSGSAAGASSYIKVLDTQTGRFINKEIRVSDHSKGAFNHENYHHVFEHGHVDTVGDALLGEAHKMRAMGPSAGLIAQQERDRAHAQKILARAARRKQTAGEALSDEERAALEKTGELRKALFLKARPTPAQAEAGNYKKPRVSWHGLEIAIEQPKGTVREGVDETGKAWRTVFEHPYGYFCRTEGMDGDEVDVYVGPDPDGAKEVYVIHQMRRKDWSTPDEDKCMVGWPSAAAAKQAYLDHYDDPRFFGSITAMPVAEFVAKVKATREKPAMIKAITSKLSLFIHASEK